MDPPLDNLCRFCMLNMLNPKAGSVKFAKLLKNRDLAANFLDYFNVPLADTDLPPKVCDDCYKLIHEYLAFRQQCFESYAKFKSRLWIVDVELKVEKSDEDTKDDPDVGEKSELRKVDVGELKVEQSDEDTAAKDPKIDESDDNDEEKPRRETKSSKIRPSSEKCARKPKQCTICGKVVARLDNHMLIHEYDRRYICHFCDRRIATKGNLTKHLRIHLQIRNFKCHICAKDFIDTSSLKKHLIVHSEARDHKCDMCDMAFKQNSSLKYHKLQVHFKKAKIMCQICDRKFYVPFHYRLHMRNVHAERPKCDICAKVLKNQKSLDIHKRIHGIGLSETDNVCHICNKACSTKNSLVNHIKCHSRPKGRAHKQSMKKAKFSNVIMENLS